VTSNATARGLYDRAGFRIYGVERHALRLGPGRYVDEELRVLELA
jgi:ribosomal protein S18 acetylase RimI-like enzyme